MSRRYATVLVAGAFALGVGASAVTAVLIEQTTAGESSSGPLIAVTTGEDPAATPCIDDAAVATSETRASNTLLEIIWSDACQAGWARITRYDGLNEGNTVTVAIFPETSPTGPDRQEATEHDVQGAYSNLLVRPTPDTLICADGSFTADGQRIDLGKPLCI